MLSQLLDRNFPDYGVGFSLNMPLRNRSAQADLIRDQASQILVANQMDVAAAPEFGLNSAAIDRLKLTPSGLNAAAESLERIAALPDPVGEIIDGGVRPNGLTGDFCAVTVEDSGVGMAPDVVAHALEPFFTTKGEGKGTGLGLSMVHGCAKQAGGAVTIRSVLGRGTVVVVYLPLSIAPGAPVKELVTQCAADQTRSVNAGRDPAEPREQATPARILT